MLQSGMAVGHVLLSLFLISVFPVRSDAFGEKDDLMIKEYVEEKGYHLNAHVIETVDGYSLVYHHISASKTSPDLPREPVLLQHGLGMSSAVFLTPDKGALAYVLADAGYDVWLANSRGNRYSRGRVNQTTLVMTDKAFWNFSIHELAVTDLKAGVEYIRTKTDHTNMHFVGHSHGGAFAFALLASEPLYQQIFASVITLAPVTFLEGLRTNYSTSSLTAKSLIETLFNESERFELENTYHMLSSVSEVYTTFCKQGLKCKTTMGKVEGTIEEHLWMDILRFQPSRTSTKFVQYFHQQIENGLTFRKHDYGAEENLKHYESPEPPAYNLTAIKSPIDIIYTDTDIFVTPKDIKHHQTVMENVTLHGVNSKNLNHFDFLWAPITKIVVNEKILHLLEKYKLQLVNKKKEASLVSTEDVTGTAVRSSKPSNVLPVRIYHFKSKKDVEQKSVSREFSRVVKILLDYEQNSNVSLLHLWLANTKVKNSNKVGVLRDIVNYLDERCSSSKIREMLKAIPTLEYQIKQPGDVDPLIITDEIQIDFNSNNCPVVSTKELITNIVDILSTYSNEFGLDFDWFKLSSTKVSNYDKFILILEVVKTLRKMCTERQCPDLSDLMNKVNDLQIRIKESRKTDKTSSESPNKIPGGNGVKNTRIPSKSVLKRIQEMYASILKRLTAYEMSVGLHNDYSALGLSNGTTIERLEMLKQIVHKINNQCRIKCNQVKAIVNDIEKLYQLVKENPNNNQLDISEPSITQQATNLIKRVSEHNNTETESPTKTNVHQQVKDLYLIILNRLTAYESSAHSQNDYSPLKSTNTTNREKLDVLKQIILKITKQCGTKCSGVNEIVKESDELYELLKQIPNIDQLDITTYSTLLQVEDLIEYASAPADMNHIKDQFIAITNKVLFHESEDKIDSTYNFLLLQDLTFKAKVTKVLHRIAYLITRCIEECVDLFRLEKELETLNIDQNAYFNDIVLTCSKDDVSCRVERSNNSYVNDTNKDAHESRFTPSSNPDYIRKELQSIEEVIKEEMGNIYGEYFTNSSSKNSKLVNPLLVTTEVTNSEMVNILLGRVELLKDKCTGSCKNVNKLINKLKNIKKQLKNVTSRDKIKKPFNKRREFTTILQPLMEYEAKLGTNYNYSFLNTPGITDKMLVRVLLERIKYLKKICAYDCKGLDELQRKVQRLDNKAEKASKVYSFKPKSSNKTDKSELRYVINTLSKYDHNLKSNFDYSLFESSNISPPVVSSILLDRVKQLKDECKENCGEINEAESKLKLLSNFKPGDREDTTDYDVARTATTVGSTETGAALTEQWVKEHYITLLKMFRKYDLDLGVLPKFDYSELNSKTLSNTEKIDIILDRLLLLQLKCTSNCDEIGQLVKQMKELRYKIETEIIHTSDLTLSYVFSDSLEAENIDHHKYQEIREEFLSILKLLRAYERKIQSNFDLSVLDSSETNAEKLNALMKLVLQQKKQCKNNCSEIIDLVEKLVKFKVRLNKQVEFNVEKLDLTLPKSTSISWLEGDTQDQPLLKRIRDYKLHINSSYFSDLE